MLRHLATGDNLADGVWADSPIVRRPTRRGWQPTTAKAPIVMVKDDTYWV